MEKGQLFLDQVVTPANVQYYGYKTQSPALHYQAGGSALADCFCVSNGQDWSGSEYSTFLESGTKPRPVWLWSSETGEDILPVSAGSGVVRPVWSSWLRLLADQGLDLLLEENLLIPAGGTSPASEGRVGCKGCAFQRTWRTTSRLLRQVKFEELSFISKCSCRS